MMTFFQVSILRVILRFNLKREMSEVRNMGRVSFTESEMRQLEANPNVQHVSEKIISYSPAFKLDAIKAHKEGKKPIEIFRAAGFDMDVIGNKIPCGSLKRWRYAHEVHGESGLLEERRGKGSTGRKPRNLSSKRRDLAMKAIAEIEDQRVALNSHIKTLFKTGSLEITDEELDKTLFLLELHPTISDLIADYEFAQQQMENGMNLYELMNAEGNARYGEHGQELNKDVTADSVVLKDKSQAIYQVYKSISTILQNVINNLRDPHERMIFGLLFVDGRRYLEAVQYLEQGHPGLYGISPTGFAEKRKRGLKKLAASLKLSGVIALVGEEIETDKNTIRKTHFNRKQFRLVFTEWE
jgi:transposase